MKKSLKQLIAGLTLATAVTAGTLAATESVAVHRADTAWGAAAGNDTGWGIPPKDGDSLPIPLSLDTGWG